MHTVLHMILDFIFSYMPNRGEAAAAPHCQVHSVCAAWVCLLHTHTRVYSTDEHMCVVTATQISTDRSTWHSGKHKQHHCLHPIPRSGWSGLRPVSGTYITLSVPPGAGLRLPSSYVSSSWSPFSSFLWVCVCTRVHAHTHTCTHICKWASWLTSSPTAWTPGPSGSHLLQVPHSQHTAPSPLSLPTG